MGSTPIIRLARWCRHVLWPIKGFVALGIVGGLVVTLGQLVQTQLVASVLAKLGEYAAVPTEDQAPGAAPWFVPEALGHAALLLAVVIVVVILLDFLVSALDASNNARLVQRLQASLHDRLLGLGPSWHDGRDSGEAAHLVNQVARGAGPLIGQIVKFPIVEGTGIVAAAAFLYYNLGNLPDTPLAIRLAGVAALFAIPALAWWLSGRERVAQADVLAAERRLNTEILNSLAQPTAIVALGAEAARATRIAATVATATAARIRQAFRAMLSKQLMTSLPTVLQALFLLYGVLITVTAETLDPAAIGAIFAIYAFVPRIVGPLMSLISFVGGINAQWPTLERVGSVLDATPDFEEPADPAPWPGHAGGIAMSDVTFAYGADGPRILDGLSHRFAPGRITAVVGRSGCGKSTIVQLVARLRQPAVGEILVGGTPLSRIATSALRRHVAVVSQFSPILTDTVRENLKLARSDATDAELEAVCRLTGLWDILVRKAPDGPLDQQMLREAGTGFSGGERRLVGITRLLLLEPDVFLFDEPSAGIDAHSLEPVVAALRAAARNATTILVEHDLGLVQALADEVCVLEAGRFVQIGPPDRLAAEPGPFRSLIEARRRLVAGDRKLEIESHSVQSLEAPPGELRIAAGAKKKGFQP